MPTYCYSRTSSRANAGGKKKKHGAMSASERRQMEGAMKLAKADAKGKSSIHMVSEVISGSLPLAERTTFKELLEKASKSNGKKGGAKLYVGETRAIARNSRVADEIWELSKRLKVTIIAADAPGLMAHDATPVQIFQRRIDFARLELERDLIVWRLKHGREAKMKLAKKSLSLTNRRRAKPPASLVTVAGAPKVSGAKSTLEKVGPLSAKQRADVKRAIQDREKGKYGFRDLRVKLSAILKINIGSHERARRIVQEFSICY